MSGAWSVERIAAYQPLGYALVLSVWYSTGLALLVAGVSRSPYAASPRSRHAIALAALTGTVALGAAPGCSSRTRLPRRSHSRPPVAQWQPYTVSRWRRTAVLPRRFPS